LPSAVNTVSLYQVINLKITIIDINDNVPTFERSEYHLRLPETAHPGTSFELPLAQDADQTPRYQVLLRSFRFCRSQHFPVIKDWCNCSTFSVIKSYRKLMSRTRNVSSFVSIFSTYFFPFSSPSFHPTCKSWK